MCAFLIPGLIAAGVIGVAASTGGGGVGCQPACPPACPHPGYAGYGAPIHDSRPVAGYTYQANYAQQGASYGYAAAQPPYYHSAQVPGAYANRPYAPAQSYGGSVDAQFGSGDFSADVNYGPGPRVY